MDYLVELKLAKRPATPEEGIVFIEQSILPTLELCKKLAAETKIVAGEVSGAIAISLIVRADSVQALDDLISSLPVWPLMKTKVTPLNTFDGRILAVRERLEHLKAQRGDL